MLYAISRLEFFYGTLGLDWMTDEFQQTALASKGVDQLAVHLKCMIGGTHGSKVRSR